VFEWDPRKAAANQHKHGVSFEQAAEVFEDPMAVTFADPDHSTQEAREITIGRSGDWIVLTVSHVEKTGKIRIISARRATRSEVKVYEGS